MVFRTLKKIYQESEVDGWFSACAYVEDRAASPAFIAWGSQGGIVVLRFDSPSLARAHLDTIEATPGTECDNNGSGSVAQVHTVELRDGITWVEAGIKGSAGREWTTYYVSGDLVVSAVDSDDPDSIVPIEQTALPLALELFPQGP